MIDIIGKVLLGRALGRLNRTEWGSRNMPYRLLLIPLGLIVASLVFIRLAA